MSPSECLGNLGPWNEEEKTKQTKNIYKKRVKKKVKNQKWKKKDKKKQTKNIYKKLKRIKKIKNK